jgi:hypothetical protein
MAVRPHSWLWYIAGLAVLGALAIAIPLVYNLRLQLKPADLQAAEERWQQQAPRDYDLEYLWKEEGDAGSQVPPERQREEGRLEVRGGVIRQALRNGVAVPPQTCADRDVTALFRLIASYLEVDSQPGAPRVYVVGQFDPADGHPVHYVRRVTSSRRRIEVIVQLVRVPEGPQPEPGG